MPAAQSIFSCLPRLCLPQGTWIIRGTKLTNLASFNFNVVEVCYLPVVAFVWRENEKHTSQSLRRVLQQQSGCASNLHTTMRQYRVLLKMQQVDPESLMYNQDNSQRH